VFINVVGYHLSCGGFQQFGYDQSQVVWNFHEALTLNLHDVGWKGSILAPLADIVNPQGNIQGQVFAKSWKANNTCSQLNWHPFSGCIPPLTCGWSIDSVFCTYADTDWAQEGCGRKRATCRAHDILDDFWEQCFPIDLRIGCNASALTLSSPSAVRNFLPQPGNVGVGVLTDNYHDATSTSAADFAGQLVSLGLTLGFDSCQVSDFQFSSACSRLTDLHVCDVANADTQKNCIAFYGMTIGEIYAAANRIIGQCPNGGDRTSSEAYKCLKFINSNWNRCQHYNGIRAEKFSFCQCGDAACDQMPPININSDLDPEYQRKHLPSLPDGILLSPASPLAPLIHSLLLLAFLLIAW